jgi:hypothetical protein
MRAIPLRGDAAVIRAEIESLEKAREDCSDSGIQRQIDVWIEERKKNRSRETLRSSP